ncbi:MAG: hypothetical protein EAZ62_05875, partial [Sphingobacteriia bacterium]
MWRQYILVLALLNFCQQGVAQCIPVTLNGPRCATDGPIRASFARKPYLTQWYYNNTAVEFAIVNWTTTSVPKVSGIKTDGTGLPRIGGSAGVAVDQNGGIYLSDTTVHAVLLFNATYPNGFPVAGGNGRGNGLRQLNRPAGISFDHLGNLYVVDQGNNRVMRYAQGSNEGQVVAGGSTINGLQLSSPVDVAVDAGSNFYVSDAGNHRVLKFLQTGGAAEVVAGGSGPGSDSAQLNSPQGIFIDTYGNLFVADSGNHRVQKFVPGFSKGATVAGANGRGNNSFQLNQPADVAVDGLGNVFVLDKANHRIQKWAPAGGVNTIAGNANGQPGTANDLLNAPSAMTFDASGNLYVQDEKNLRLAYFEVSFLATTYNARFQGNYLVHAYNFFGCLQISNVVNVLANLPIKVVGNLQNCVGDTVFVKLQGAGNYTWSPQRNVQRVNDSVYYLLADSTRNYLVTSTSANGCTTQTNVFSQVGNKIRARISATLCQSPDTAHIKVSLTGGKAAVMQWFTSDTFLGNVLPDWDKSGAVALGGNGIGMSPAQFNLPVDMFMDRNGNQFVVDALNHRVQRFKPGEINGTTIAGMGGVGSGNNQLNYPTGVALDVEGNIFVVDQNNHRVIRIAQSDQSISVIMGGTGPGSGEQQLSFPSRIFVDASGIVYVTDAGNHRVVKWNPITKSVVRAAGTGIAGNQFWELSNPQGMWVDQNSTLFVADAGNHRIMMYAKDSLVGYPIAGGRGAGTDFRQFNNPTGIWGDQASNLYIADRGNHRIQRWALFDTAGVTVLGTQLGNAGSGLQQLNQPTALHVDLTGKFWVVDSRNHRIQQYNIKQGTDSLFFATKSGLYAARVSSFDGCTTASNFTEFSVQPNIQLQAEKTSFCVGGSSFLKASSDSGLVFNWQPALGLNQTTGDSVMATPQQSTLYTVTTTKSGCNGKAEVLVVVNPLPQTQLTGEFCLNGQELKLSSTPFAQQVRWQSGNTLLRRDSTTWLSNGATIAGSLTGGPDSNQLGRPSFVFVDKNGNTYICDQWNHRVQKWVPGAAFGTTVAGGNGAGNAPDQLKNPLGIYVDDKGVVYVADTDNDRIQRWAPGAKFGTTVAGGRGRGIGPEQLSYPAAVLLDAFGNIFIADALNARVQKWKPGAFFGTTVAGGNFGGGDSSQLSVPLGIALDARGNLYIADSQNDRIQRWAPGAKFGTTVAGGRGRGLGSQQLNFPINVALKDDNTLLITESNNSNRVKLWRLGATAGTVVAGQSGAGSTPNLLNAPGNATTDTQGRLYVSDMNNFRVLRFSFADTSWAFKPTQRGAYSYQATSAAGCVAAPVLFSIDSGFIPSPPIVADSKYCLNDPARPLQATGDSLVWFASSSGGTGSAIAPLPNTRVVGKSEFWVARTNALQTCTSVREKITVTVNPLPGARLSVQTKNRLLPGDTTYLLVKSDTLKSISEVRWFKNSAFQPQ